MPVFFLRLENALKRANEFIDVGKKARALEILCDVLRSRKHRTWQKKHEDIMIKYLELCVELRKIYIAKEGIFQYKIICHQQAYIKSFEDVVRQYLSMAEAKAEAAREESQALSVSDDVDDLDNMQTPESILMSAVCSEDTQDRTDRVVLLPWVKFLWESYKQCLDLLKNNARTERLYHDIAYQAFQFCIKYNRKTEFRKLCDTLHLHLESIKKQQSQSSTQAPHQQQNIVNLSNPESQGMHLETRLVQLDFAIQMELWQEAYRATDDIKKFNLMNLSKKPPKPQLMASYYQKLSLVFWKANCPLFHAAALFRLFNLTKELRKNITFEDVQKMASKVVVATLSIPFPPTRCEIDKLVDTEENVIENHQRNLSSLLDLTASVPTRSSLIRDLKRMGILQLALPTFQDLYQYLEVEFHPLLLTSRVAKCIEFIETNEACSELRQYVNALKDVTVFRVLKEISQVYQSIECSRVLELCRYVDNIKLEHMIVSAARRNDLQVRIDHRKKCLYFGTELRVSQGEEIIEGPHLQSMPSEQIRQQLITMYSALQKARALLEPAKIKSRRDELKRKIMLTYEMNRKLEHERILDRQNYIERRKEELEQIGIEREKEERKLLEEKQQKLREAEEERMAKEAEERARQRKLREDMELKKRMALDQIEKMKQTDAGLRLLDGINEDDLYKLKLEDIKNRQWKQLEKERIDQIAKQRNYERKVDHFERAKRLEELPLLKKYYQDWKENDEKMWEEMEIERIKEIVYERKLALENKERLKRMFFDAEDFKAKINAERYEVYSEKLSEWTLIVNKERAKRLMERKAERKKERADSWLKKKQDEENRKIREAEEKKRKAEEKLRNEALARQEEATRRAEEKLEKQTEELRKLEAKEMERSRKTISDNWRNKDDVDVEEDLSRRRYSGRSSKDYLRDKPIESSWRSSDFNQESSLRTSKRGAGDREVFDDDRRERKIGLSDRDRDRSRERELDRNRNRDLDRDLRDFGRLRQLRKPSSSGISRDKDDSLDYQSKSFKSEGTSWRSSKFESRKDEVDDRKEHGFRSERSFLNPRLSKEKSRADTLDWRASNDKEEKFTEKESFGSERLARDRMDGTRKAFIFKKDEKKPNDDIVEEDGWKKVGKKR